MIRKISLIVCIFITSITVCFGSIKKVLVLNEGVVDQKSKAVGISNQLLNLLGHFDGLSVSLKDANSYKKGDIEAADYVFYVGYSSENKPTDALMNDVLKSKKNIFWINSGFDYFSSKYDVKQALGFDVKGMATGVGINTILSGTKLFTKEKPICYQINIANKAVNIVAKGKSSKTKKETPYIVRSGNFWYIADLPFLNATETDRYLLFCDLLHDFLGINHAASHQAMIRIEDVTPMDNPDRIRDIADIFASEGVPFLLGFVPIYINPTADIHVNLSDRPEMVDALKYVIENGGTIIMHGVTHQYRGMSTDDFEFWDGAKRQPIAEENTYDIEIKLKNGIDEFIKNDIYPMLWETPHYTASELTYKTVAKHFSAAIEQRLTINDFDFGQSFPYIIKKDLYGQTIYPENQGYVPLNSNLDSSIKVVERIISNSKTMLNVRDGIASCFFHSFLDLQLLKQLIKGFKANGFTFLDMRNQPLTVSYNDKLITTKSGEHNLTYDNSFMVEQYFDYKGNIILKSSTQTRLKGIIKKNIQLKKGQFYVAEPIENKVQKTGMVEQFLLDVKNTYTNWVTDKNKWQQARVKICWNEYAKGASYKDQCSLASMFKSVNIPVDTIFVGEKLDLNNCNILIVPFAFCDSLTSSQINRIKDFIKHGGNLITDKKNKLLTNLDFKFLESEIKVHDVRDNFYPQQHIVWKMAQPVKKLEVTDNDEIFCQDAASGMPMAIGRNYGEGKIIYFTTLFDPYSTLGYSMYPFALDYARRFFAVNPVVRKENLDYYFDPGLRQTTSVENLVKIWVKQGVRYIHVSGWHQYPKYDYDYARLIKLCHENGILVYAWIEPPQVSQKFWQNHPEWREKNYIGKDVRASWRYPVALTDKKCLAAATKEYINLLTKFDFDGVNLAELYFESDNGFENPEKFMPMHASAKAEFKSRYKFDLPEIFNASSSFYWMKNINARKAVIQYRVNKIKELHESILSAIYKSMAKKPGFDVILTFMDSYESPEMTEFVGINSDVMIALQKKFGCRLQVEDPESRWNDSPDRYKQLGDKYTSQIHDRNKILLDLNIMQFRKSDKILPFPTLTQTGIESYHLINSSSLGAPRYTIYCEGSVNPQDMPWFMYASATDVKMQITADGYSVESPSSFVLRLPSTQKIITVDGKQIIGQRDNAFFIAAGKHTININDAGLPGFSTVQIQPEILTCSGNVTELAYDMRKVTFTYESDMITIASFNQAPAQVFVDGKEIKDIEVMKGNDCYSIKLPNGTHSVKVIMGSSLSYSINLTSLWSTNAIVIYGGLAVISLLLMFFGLKIIRRKYEKTA